MTVNPTPWPSRLAVVVLVALVALMPASDSTVPFCDTEQPAWQPGVTADWALMGPDRERAPFTIEGVEYFHPVLTVQRATYLLNVGRVAEARALADELLAEAERRDGALWFTYRFDWPGTEMQAPWYSAMAQGMALSLFSRLEMPEAEKVHRSLEPGAGVNRDGWLDEYPGFPVVLNGAIFAVYGLYDYWQATGERAILDSATDRITDNLHRWRHPGAVSAYELEGTYRFGDYHRLHVRQLGVLTEMADMDCVRRAAAAFAADA